MDKTAAPLPSLDELRVQIDSVDEEIVKLLNKRARFAVQVGQVKAATGVQAFAPHREKAVFEKVRALNTGPLPDRCLEAVYRELISGALALERPLRIGYLGPAGTFSHAASIRKFGSSVDYVPLTDIASVFAEVARGQIDHGLVPVENSIGGSIVDTLDAFLQSSARICSEVLISVHHNVLSKEPWENVRRVYSKPEAFAQCRTWLLGMAEDRDVQPAASTAKAAELAASEPGAAAIGAAIAGQIYGLNVLFENVEDNPDNVTRFFVIGRESARRSGEDKTAIMFTTAHKPGALAEVLDVFRDNGINLTDIEKRPSKKVNWEYYFFIDAVGHAEDPNMIRAIEAAREHCLQLTVLGSYPKAKEVL